MTTWQEIHDKQFTIARKGYNPDEVDDLLVKIEQELRDYESLSNDYQTLKKSYNELLTKARAVALKNEEYRGSEFAIGQAMKEAQQIRQKSEIDAQARADSIISAAKSQAADILDDAKAKAENAIAQIDSRIVEEETRLQEAKLSAAKFLDTVRTLCMAQLAKLDAIAKSTHRSVPAEPAAPAAEAADDAMRIQAEEISGVEAEPEAEALNSDNTQVFSFSKEN